ncbi:MAG: hypothetical protein AAGI52_06325 [Bacteroidota bacterium]
MTRFVTPLAFLLLAFTVAACGSARGAYDDAMEAEAAGDLPRAFDRYHTALRRDETIGTARDRLAIVGRQLVEGSLADATRAEPTRAADLYIQAEGYVSRAAEVGVPLDLPGAFDADRDAAFAAAVASLIGAAAEARQTGTFSDALGLLRRADTYRPTEEERVALDDEARLIYTGWAEDDLARGRFRRAFSSTESALGFLAPESEAALALRSLQAAIVAAGSIRVAFFPLETGSDTDGDRGPVGRTGTRPPFGFVADLDDVLNDDHWTRPPLFVLSADPADVRRALRRERDANDLFRNHALLSSLAGDLDADLGAAMEVIGWSETEEEASRDTRTADSRSGGTATYDRVRLRLERGATVEYVVVDARRQPVCEGEVRREARTTLTVHEADDWRDLQLSRDDRRLFTEDHRDETEADLHADLLERLAGAVAERVYRCIGQRVP